MVRHTSRESPSFHLEHKRERRGRHKHPADRVFTSSSSSSSPIYRSHPSPIPPFAHIRPGEIGCNQHSTLPQFSLPTSEVKTSKMGASFSAPTTLFLFSNKTHPCPDPTSTTPVTMMTTPSKKKKQQQQPKRYRKPPPNTISRRSRRIQKSGPLRVVFPTLPRQKTPTRKKFPLTPNSRAIVEARIKPILRSSSSHRHNLIASKAKHKIDIIPKKMRR